MLPIQYSNISDQLRIELQLPLVILWARRRRRTNDSGPVADWHSILVDTKDTYSWCRGAGLNADDNDEVVGQMRFDEGAQRATYSNNVMHRANRIDIRFGVHTKWNSTQHNGSNHLHEFMQRGGGGEVEIRIYFGILFEIQVHHNILLINVACHFYCAGESLSDPWMVGDGYRNNAGVTEVVSRILCKWV